MQAKIENNELVIRIPLEKPKPSSSGKPVFVGLGRIMVKNMRYAKQING